MLWIPPKNASPVSILPLDRGKSTRRTVKRPVMIALWFAVCLASLFNQWRMRNLRKVQHLIELQLSTFNFLL